MQNTVYEKITSQFIEALNKGIVPWKKPFMSNANFITKKEYQGINSLAIACGHFACPYWVTFKQAGELGGKIRKGEKGTVIAYWQCKDRVVENDLGNEEIKKGFILRYSTIFNLEQTEGIQWEVTGEVKTLIAAETIIANYKNAPEVIFEEDRAYYSPLRDIVNLPKKQKFISYEEFYCTAFHELVHFTGHVSRLDRIELCSINFFGDHSYSKEELVAEIGAAFLCCEAGILNVTMANSEAYIAGWARALGNDSRMIVEAAGKARKAVQFIRDPEGGRV